jgi:hypothetical protein
MVARHVAGEPVTGAQIAAGATAGAARSSA